MPIFLYPKYSYKKKQWTPSCKKKKRGKNLSPRTRKACHSINTAFMQSATEIGTQSTMKSNMKTLHEFSPHIPPKTVYLLFQAMTVKSIGTTV
jgi:hypothetical protein